MFKNINNIKDSSLTKDSEDPPLVNSGSVTVIAMHQRFNVLGVGVCAINMEMALDTIDQWISERKSNYITVTGVHGVVESQFDEDLRQIFNQSRMVTPDGMPMVWLGRQRGFEFVDRVYGPDLMLAVCE